MCGRFLLHAELEVFKERYNIRKDKLSLPLKREVFPSQATPVIINQGNNWVQLMKWGFSPSFAKGLIINTRSETIDQKPTFRKPFINNRCIVPASGFFEWMDENGEKIKYLITINDQPLISLAAIYDTFPDQEGEQRKAFSIITTEASKSIEDIHHRMPVILEKEMEKTGLTLTFKIRIN